MNVIILFSALVAVTSAKCYTYEVTQKKAINSPGWIEIGHGMSLEECKHLCNSMSSCTRFTYSRSGSDKTCYSAKPGAAIRVDTRYDMHTKKEIRCNRCNSYEVTEKKAINSPGWEEIGHGMSLDQCKDLCNTISSCTRFTYSRNGFDKTCYSAKPGAVIRIDARYNMYTKRKEISCNKCYTYKVTEKKAINSPGWIEIGHGMSLEECKNLCNTISSCTRFTYSRSGSDKTCYSAKPGAFIRIDTRYNMHTKMEVSCGMCYAYRVTEKKAINSPGWDEIGHGMSLDQCKNLCNGICSCTRFTYSRNGLDKTCYSAKPGAVIRNDARYNMNNKVEISCGQCYTYQVTGKKAINSPGWIEIGHGMSLHQCKTLCNTLSSCKRFTYSINGSDKTCYSAKPGAIIRVDTRYNMHTKTEISCNKCYKYEVTEKKAINSPGWTEIGHGMTLDQCKKLCNKMSTCTRFTYSRSGSDKTCYSAKPGAAIRVDTRYDMHTKTEVICPKCYNYEVTQSKAINYPGWTEIGHNKSLEECKNLCITISSCTRFTYSKNGSDKTCYSAKPGAVIRVDARYNMNTKREVSCSGSYAIKVTPKLD